MIGFLKSKIAKVIYAVVGLAVVGIIAFAVYLKMALVDVGETAQDWTLKTPDGDSVVFYEVSDDQPSVLIFWATWCGYCQKLMPQARSRFRRFRRIFIKSAFSKNLQIPSRQ